METEKQLRRNTDRTNRIEATIECVKLLKLEITNFQAMHLDWQRLTIDGLSFTAERHERAKINPGEPT